MRRFSVGVVILLSIVSIAFGKIVRHTIMYESLVLPGVGWRILDQVNSDNLKFGLTIHDSNSVEERSNAMQNACFIISKINFLKLTKSYYGYEILISIIWNIIILLIIVNLKKSFSLIETLFLLLSVAVLNIFDFCLAKEPIQMLYFLFIYLILISKMDEKIKFILSFLIYVLCFFTYRNYYILMAGFMVYLLLLYKYLISHIKKVNRKHIIIILLSIYICYFVFLNIVKIIDMSAFNELLRVRLRTSSATSDMHSIFSSTNIYIFTLDYIIMIIRMLFPIELVRMGPKYFIYFIYQVFITYYLIKNITNINKISTTKKITLFVFIAFLLGSAAFEPDFGSWVRHEAVLFPIIMIMSGIKKLIMDERYVKDSGCC